MAYLPFEEDGTVMVVDLNTPLGPGRMATFELTGRRSASPNPPFRMDEQEGVEYSMTQWFPKICEFDHHGWHSNPTSGGSFTAFGVTTT